MPIERITTTYARLFDVHLLHHYWLDEGAVLFDALPAAVRQNRLLHYDVRQYLHVEPTPETRTALEGIKAVFVPTTLGFTVGVNAAQEIDPDLMLDFTLRIADTSWMSYTAYGLTMPSSANVVQTTTKKTFRYRANGALYSNMTGASRMLASGKKLFLTQDHLPPSASDKAEHLVNNSGTLVQLLGDQPGALTAVVAPTATNHIVYANHHDIPTLTPPPNIMGTVPAQGFLLPDGADADAYALIRIGMVRSSDHDFSCLSGGVAKATPPTFQIRFKNRQTLWRYCNKNDPSVIRSESGPHPLTFHGNATSTQKPPIGPIDLDRSGSRIINLVSKVFT